MGEGCPPPCGIRSGLLFCECSNEFAVFSSMMRARTLGTIERLSGDASDQAPYRVLKVAPLHGAPVCHLCGSFGGLVVCEQRVCASVGRHQPVEARLAWHSHSSTLTEIRRSEVINCVQKSIEE